MLLLITEDGYLTQTNCEIGATTLANVQDGVLDIVRYNLVTGVFEQFNPGDDKTEDQWTRIEFD